MGWCESPPLLCSESETERYVIDTLLHEVKPLDHPFEEHMTEYQTDNLRHSIKSEVTYKNMVEVFEDNFIDETNNPYLSHHTHLSRAMLHGVNSISPPPQILLNTN